MIPDQTVNIYLTSPSGDMFTNPFFLFATCFIVKPSSVTFELPMQSGGSAEMWISPDAAREFHSPYSYNPNPINNIDPDGNQSIESMFRWAGINPRLNEVIEPSPFEVNLYANVSVDLGLSANLGIVEFQFSFMKETRSYLPDLEAEFSQGAFVAIPFLKKWGVGVGFERTASRQEDVVKAKFLPIWQGERNKIQANGGVESPVRIGLGLATPVAGGEFGLEFSKRK